MKSIMLNLIFLSLSLPVMANTVKFEFSGYIDTINSNENNALGNVYLNQPFNGWFSYSSVPDQLSDPVYGSYAQDASISVTLGTQTLSYIDDFVGIAVYNNYFNEDEFSFGVDGQQGDFNFTNFGVKLSDSTGMVYNNDDLPMSFNLTQFDSTRLTIAGSKYPSHDWFYIGGEITNMTLVPEPATAEVVIVEVEGVVDSVWTDGGLALDGSVNIGSVMTGSATYDTETPDLNPIPENGEYALLSISMTVGNYTFMHDPTSSEYPFFNVYTINPGYSAATVSYFDGTVYLDGTPQSYEDIDWSIRSLRLMRLLTSSGEYIPTDALPDLDSWPELSVFDMSREFEVIFHKSSSYGDGDFVIHGEITSLTVVRQPATTYYVDALNGDDYNDGLSPETAFATIQKGIDSANDGDTVIVAPGTYTGEGNRDIDFLGKAITVRSIDPNDPNIVAATIIDCNGTEDEPHRGFYFHNDEDASSVVAGLTITNGYDWYDSGGIRCNNSSPTITDCIISGNVNSWGRGGGGAISILQSISIINNCVITGNNAMIGAGISCRYSSPTITNCTISGNSAEYYGGGMLSADGNPTLTNCTFSGNSADYGGGMFNYASNPTLTNCIFSGNSAIAGGGMYNNYSSPTLTNCTLVGNSAIQGNALACYSLEQSPYTVELSNCILWDGGNEIYKNDDSEIAITYSDIQGGWPGEGNIDDDPCFVQLGYWDMNNVWVEGDYHLLRTSPCIDAANDANVYTDIEGNIRPFDFPGVDNNGELPEFDMGAYEATAEEAELMILPGVINRHSRQRRIWAWVRLPEGITRDQIDSDEPLLLYPDVPEANGIEAIRQCVFQNRRRRSQRTSILAFFDKAELMDAVGDNDNGSVELQVVGRFVSPGQYFYGSDTVRINSRRGRPREHRQLQRVRLNYGGEE